MTVPLRTLAAVVLLPVLLPALASPGAADDDLSPMATLEAAVATGDAAAAVRVLAVTRPQTVPGRRYGEAAAAVHRLLGALSPRDRYEALAAATIDQPGEQSVIIRTPTAAPPAEFARLLRRRPSDDVFALPRVATLEGWFWLRYQTVRAAIDAAAAADLVRRVEAIDEPDRQQRWLQFVDAMRARRGGDALRPLIEKLTADSDHAATLSVQDAVLLWLSADDRLPSGWLHTWAKTRQQVYGRRMAPLLRTSSPDRDRERPARLDHWIVDPGPLAGPGHTRVRAREHHLWLAGEGTRLWSRQPLAGRFAFSVQSQAGGIFERTGHLGYGGQRAWLTRQDEQLAVAGITGPDARQAWAPFFRYQYDRDFNRLTLRQDEPAGSPLLAINAHQMLPVGVAGDEGPSPIPFVDLGTATDVEAMYRRPELTDASPVPTEIDLLEGISESWLTVWPLDEPKTAREPATVSLVRSLLGGGQSPKGVQPSSTLVPGVSVPDRTPKVMWFPRPLQEGETIRYTFLTGEPDRLVPVAPAIGRLAFVFGERGLRTHYLTDAELLAPGAADWTGLPADNALLEPRARRSRSLDLKPNTPTEATVAIRDGQIELSIGGELAYVRELPPGAASHFGLYAPGGVRTGAISRCTLSGPWGQAPEPSAFSFAGANMPVPWTVIGDEILAEDYPNLRRELTPLTASDRVDRLLAWLAPSGSLEHRTMYLMVGTLPPGDPSPLVVGDPAYADWADPDAALPPRLVHPAIDLVTAAIQSERLDDVRTLIATAEPNAPEQQTVAAVLQGLIAAATGDDLAAATERLIVLLPTVPYGDAPAWSYLAYAAAVDRADRWNPALSDLMAEAVGKWAERETPSTVPLASQLRRLAAERRVPDELRAAAGDMRWATVVDGTPPGQSAFLSTSRVNRLPRGRGLPRPLWVLADGTLMHESGHWLDYLMLRQPLPETYDLQAETSNYHGTAMHAEGIGFDMNAGDYFVLTNLRGAQQRVDRKEVPKHDNDVRYRIAKDEDRIQTFFNGMPEHDGPVAANAPPWFSFRAWRSTRSGLRLFDVRSDAPVPDSVAISHADQHTYWLPDHDASFDGEYPDWIWTASTDPETPGEPIQIEARRRGERIGTGLEDLLVYNRPLVGSARVDYRFEFDPGRLEVSPAVGRLVMLVGRDGLATHHLTDGRFDRSTVSPTNRSAERPWPDDPAFPGGRLAAGWHRASVQTSADRVLLAIDGVPVYEAPLTVANARGFGLFHYANQTAARVSGITLRGDWDGIDTADTILADRGAAALGAAAAALPDRFEIDFETPPPKRVTGWQLPWLRTRMQIEQASLEHLLISGSPRFSSAGVQLSAVSRGSWTQSAIMPQFHIDGDFAVEATFENLAYTNARRVDGRQAGVRIEVNHQSPTVAQTTMVVEYYGTGDPTANGGANLINPDGSRRWPTQGQKSHATSGTMRMVRTGSTMSSLFAEGGSQNFRLLRQQEVPTGPVRPGDIKAMVFGNNGGGVSVQFTRLALAAERLRVPPSEKDSRYEALIAKNTQTGAETVLTIGSGERYHVGSPDISPDGQWVAFNRNSENPANSQIEIVPIDGSAKPRVLWEGAVPTWSPDGRRLAYYGATEDNVGVFVRDRDGGGRRQLSPSGNAPNFLGDGRVVFADDEQLFIATPGSPAAPKPILTGDLEDRYSFLSWHTSADPAGRRVIVRGYRRDRSNRGYELAMFDLRRPSTMQVLLDDAGPVRPQCSFLDDGRILMIGNIESPQSRVLAIDPARPNEAVPTGITIETIPQPLDMEVSPDGGWIVVGGTIDPPLSEWEDGQVVEAD